ncbi:MAG: Bax inhibitor-1 family protein [Bacilli bacterium]|nr:Bax inhibitor-1 family protein [Bacilli bacterium]
MATYDFNTSTPGSSGVGVRSTQGTLLGKAFTYMFLFLLLTVAITVGVSVIFQFGIKDIDVRNNAYMITLITASITQIVLTVVIAFTSLRRGKAAVIPLVLYAVCMGVLLSSFTFLGLEWYTLAATFGIAALAFGGMALIGTRSKRAVGMGLVGFGLLFGVLMMGLFNLIFFLVLGPEVWAPINIITSIIVIIAIMLITAFDVYNIKQISMRCQADNNLALYLAFNLYLDFIIILIHILRLVVIFSSNNR